MTNETGPGGTRTFVTSVLPWLLGAVMFAVYLATLQQTATPYSLDRLAEIRGWSWNPSPFAPVAYLLTLPIRALSGSSAVLALNGLSALCAALTLVLLARTVALLPHDRTNEQREREANEFSLLSIRAAWLPPVFAVLVCGLQLSFWERAIEFRQQSALDSGEMINMVLFAYVIRCLLEYRLYERESWLLRCAVAYGVGMANDWAMICFLPAFLVAVVWIKGFEFFNWRFLLRMAGCGLAGLSLILVYPIVLGANQSPHLATFWQVLTSILSVDKYVLFHFQFPRSWLLLISLTSLLPVFVIGVRWASSFGDNSPLGIFLAKSAFNIIHGFFLLVCVWVALGPPFGARQIQQVPVLPFLTHYYLGALSIGYLTGYFLLVFGTRPFRPRSRPRGVVQWLNRGVTACVWLLVIVTPAILARKNLVQINEEKSTLGVFDRLCSRMGQVLPREGAVILSDDPLPLHSLEASLDRKGMASTHLFVETAPLKGSEMYRTFLQDRHPEFSLKAAFGAIAPSGLSDINCIHMLEKLSEKHEIYYIQPSFGYYFERFYAQPRGLAYRMIPYPTNTWKAPVLSAEQTKENQQIWKEAEADLDYILRAVQESKSPEHPGFWEQLTNTLRLAPEANSLAKAVGKHYSKALDYWGVRLSDSGMQAEAGDIFDMAKRVSTDNVSAIINWEFNRDMQAGKRPVIQPLRAFDDKLGNHSAWLQVFNDCGPVAEPTFCMEMGTAFGRGLNYRQSVEQFRRAQAFMPDSPWPSLQICQLLLSYPYHPNDAYYSYPPLTEAYAEALAAAERAAGTPTNVLTPSSLYLKGVCLVQLAAHSGDSAGARGNYSNALVAANEVLKLAPDEPYSLFLKSVCLIQLDRHAEAIPALDRVLQVQTNNYAAWLNRAIANLKTDRLDAAKRDYEMVAAAFPKTYQVFYGLGDIAYRQKDNPTAVKNYELYLASLPTGLTNSEEAKQITTRLEELKRDPP